MASARYIWGRISEWIPVVVLVALCIAWFSPLGVLAAFAVTMVIGAIQEFVRRLVVGRASGEWSGGWPDDEQPIGGARLRSTLRELPLLDYVPAVDQILHAAEIGMGGPVIAEYLLRDGAIIDGISVGPGWHQDGANNWRDISGSSLRAASGHHGALVYDEQRRTLLRLAAGPRWEFWPEFHRRERAGEAMADWLLDFPSQATQYRQFHGLWLPPDHSAFSKPMLSWLHHQLPNGRTLTARSLLPDDLRLTNSPAWYLYGGPFALYADGIDTQRHVCGLDDVAVSPEGDFLVVESGVCLMEGESERDVWLVQNGCCWQAIKALGWVCIGRRRESVQFRLVSISDDGVLVMETIGGWMSDEQRVIESSTVRLAVEWQESELTLPAHKGRFSIQIPRCTH